jgi:peptidoglycan/xylan/chitin deacetylase (PgdA/CDA1 family)
MRRGIMILLALTLGWAAFGDAATAEAELNVSLTFDDGNADQMPAVQMLTDHGVTGTFYIISGRVGQTAKGYMTWSQVQSIFDAGNEIGGHTRNHVHLAGLTAQQQNAEICGGRDDLLSKGYPQVSFAYPFGDHDATSEAQVEACDYLSGRRVGGIGGTGEPKADTIPPQDQWLVRTRGSVDVNDTLPEIKDWITDAEAVDAGNGSADAWFTLVFHHLCDPNVSNCSDPNGVDGQYITPQDFDSLLDFLEDQNSTQVLPMAQVMDPNPPTSQIECNGDACQSGLYGDPVSATLSASDTGGSGVSGVQNIRYTTDGSNPNGSSPIYSGAISVGSTTTIRFRAEDNARNVESPIHSQTIAIASPPEGGGGTPGGDGGTLGALASSRSLPNGTARLVFAVGGPGTLDAVDAGSHAAAKKSGRARIKPASKFVAEAGDATLVIRASKVGKGILRRKGKMTVPVRVTFTPQSGSPASRTVKLKLRLKRRHSA